MTESLWVTKKEFAQIEGLSPQGLLKRRHLGHYKQIKTNGLTGKAERFGRESVNDYLRKRGAI